MWRRGGGNEAGVSDEHRGKRSAATKARGLHAMGEAAGLCTAGVTALRCERGMCGGESSCETEYWGDWRAAVKLNESDSVIRTS